MGQSVYGGPLPVPIGPSHPPASSSPTVPVPPPPAPLQPGIFVGLTQVVERRRYVDASAPFLNTKGIGPLEKEARITYLQNLAPSDRALVFKGIESTDSYTNPEFRTKYYLAGFVMGDFSIYRKFAKDCKGDIKKLRAAIAAHQFEGTINDDGSLSYGGVTTHWNDLSNIPGVS